MQPAFPVIFWGNTRVEFFALQGEEGAPAPNLSPTIVLIYALQDYRFVLADIAGRGWCIPGGRIEAGETPEQAAEREVYEEIGGSLADLRRIGGFLHTNTMTGDTKWVIAYLAHVAALAPLPAGTESLGVCLVTREELPTRYYLWDPLIKASFDYVCSLL